MFLGFESLATTIQAPPYRKAGLFVCAIFNILACQLQSDPSSFW